MAKFIEALDTLAQGGFKLGEQWDATHDACQRHEGEAGWDRLHALCHRIEGDDANARYWYRSAGVEPFSGSFADEAGALRADL
jgi:hypothetical protein